MRSCHFCGSSFRANETLAHFGRGEIVAYDRQRGRLWAVCDRCGRWSLEPLESRWEAIEEIDRVATDRGRTLSSTDNVAYMRAGRLTVVRIGQAPAREEAWWRYGETMLERSRLVRRTERWGKIRDSLLISLLAGFPLPSWRDPAVHVERRRRRQFGSTAWNSTLMCVDCGAPRTQIDFAETGNLQVRAGAAGELSLAIECGACREGRAQLAGVTAEHLLRRVLAFHNYRGGTEATVAHAAGLVERAGSAEAYTGQVTGRQPRIGELDTAESLALEIGTSAGHERALLSLEASVLERRWREEEAIAAIVDGELS